MTKAFRVGMSANSLGRSAALASVLAAALVVPGGAAATAPVAASAPATPPAYVRGCGPSDPGYAHCDVLIPAGSPSSADAVSPAVNPAVSPSGLLPAQLQSAYSLPSGSGGSGMTVAIVDAYDLPSAESTMATYRAQFGLPACTSASGCFRRVDQNGGTSYPVSGVGSGWDNETALDLEMVSAICPLCHIILVEATTTSLGDLGTATQTAVAMGANAVSNSYGTSGESVGETTWDVYYNHPGTVITASTGDCGYLDHLAPCSATSVEYPATSPYVVAVGGTSLTAAANTRGWTETAWSGAGSGCSIYEPKPFWQTDANCAKKAQADISAVANPSTGVAVYDPNGPGGGWTVYGGTSAAAPIVAAAYALTGHPAPATYPLRRLYANTASLYDVTSGSNGSCGGGYLCTGAAGYDGPTGLGTPHGTTALTRDVIATGAGTRNSCALAADGSLSCWGYNGGGEDDVPAGSFVALSTSDDHSCAIDTAAALHCWGNNTGGMAPATVAGSYIYVATGANDTCAIDTAHALHCWGDNSYGQASTHAGTYAAVAVGARAVCAIGTSIAQAITCWGDNSLGQTSAPAGTATAITAGDNHFCALSGLGFINCWGDNGAGQAAIQSGRFLDIEAGWKGTCALSIDGTTTCWGDNTHGQNSPPGSVAYRVGLGKYQGCVQASGGVVCWGLNTDGQAVPLFAAASLPDVYATDNYFGDVALSTAVVPAVSYTVSSGALPGGITLSSAGHFSGSPTTPGTYNFTVRASNGIAPAATVGLSIHVLSGTGLPGKPTTVTALGTDGSAVVSWSAPATNGGATISSYTVSSSPPGHTCTTSGLSCTVSGLTNRSQYSFSVVATNIAGPGSASDATGLVTPLAGATYVPVVPNRLVDSRSGATRTGLSASLSNNVPVSFQVTGRVPGDATKNIPANAVAVTGNLTVAGGSAKGYFALTPARPSGIPGVSTLNFPTGDNRANGVTVQLGSGGVLWVTYEGTGGNANVIFDVTGYFTPDASGATYVAVVPNRLVDSRAGASQTGLSASLSNNVPVSFQVTGRVAGDATKNIPSNAVAVTGNLTVAGGSAKGYFALTPARPSGIPGVSTLNFPTGDNRANGVTVQLGSGGVLWVTYEGTGGNANVIFDVTGYFTPDASGATYVAVVPNRLVDSRAGATQTGIGHSLVSNAPASFQVTGRVPSDATKNIPSSAVAVTGNLTVAGGSAKGYFALTPDQPSGIPGVSTLNFPTGDNRANGVTVQLGAGGVLWVTYEGSGGDANAIFDVTGYFTM